MPELLYQIGIYETGDTGARAFRTLHQSFFDSDAQAETAARNGEFEIPPSILIDESGDDRLGVFVRRGEVSWYVNFAPGVIVFGDL